MNYFEIFDRWSFQIQSSYIHHRLVSEQSKVKIVVPLEDYFLASLEENLKFYKSNNNEIGVLNASKSSKFDFNQLPPPNDAKTPKIAKNIENEKEELSEIVPTVFNEWDTNTLQKNLKTIKKTNSEGTDVAPNTKDVNPPVCKFYSSGKVCYKGEKCAFLHAKQTSNESETGKRALNVQYLPELSKLPCKYGNLCPYGENCFYHHLTKNKKN
eukprot:gene570-8080_t